MGSEAAASAEQVEAVAVRDTVVRLKAPPIDISGHIVVMCESTASIENFLRPLRTREKSLAISGTNVRYSATIVDHRALMPSQQQQIRSSLKRLSLSAFEPTTRLTSEVSPTHLISIFFVEAPCTNMSLFKPASDMLPM